MSRNTNPWTKLTWDMMSLGAESAAVVGLRAMTIAAGGPEAASEAELMVREKIQAANDLQSLALTGALGWTAPRVASRTIAHYRRKVRANRRRLLKRTR